jgi:hypothetical protein
MTTPDDEAGPRQERRVPDAQRLQRRFPDTGRATTPGLVVTEEHLADGRAITYFEVPASGAASEPAR